ncbi:uncharacterized protein LOC132195949 [Neocloeon triangulifer]|uniref:uncharacterized protein LOC132195949 n=1 Tax=Neocloeon triangulifer TaxID=2078957 RepID=UPI00286F3C81|nr:uncharacterized protein LOC132195949 [Neocloeon triangulifer]
MDNQLLFALCIRLLNEQSSADEEDVSWKATLLLARGKRKKSLNRIIEIYARKVQNRGIKHAVPNFTLKIFKCYLERNDEVFRSHFRLHITTYQKLISFLFEEEKVHGWSLEIELMIFLYWLATGCSYHVASASFEMPKSTIIRIIHKYLKMFASNLKKFVKLPKADELSGIGAGFCALAKNDCFKEAVGAIDGCRVKIAKVPEDQAGSYFYKGSHSSNFQAVVDHKGHFIDVFIGYPGSVHDSRIFRNSPLFVNQTYPPRGYYLLGDGGYPLLSAPITVIIPFTATQINADQAQGVFFHNSVMKTSFNALHSRARSVVKIAFGRLKARWRSIFLYKLKVLYTRVPQVIASCIALQNFFLNCDDIFETEILNVDEDDGNGNVAVRLQDQDVSGEALRLTIAETASRLIFNGHLANDHCYI